MCSSLNPSWRTYSAIAGNTILVIKRLRFRCSDLASHAAYRSQPGVQGVVACGCFAIGSCRKKGFYTGPGCARSSRRHGAFGPANKRRHLRSAARRARKPGTGKLRRGLRYSVDYANALSGTFAGRIELGQSYPMRLEATISRTAKTSLMNSADAERLACQRPWLTALSRPSAPSPATEMALPFFCEALATIPALSRSSACVFCRRRLSCRSLTDQIPILKHWYCCLFLVTCISSATLAAQHGPYPTFCIYT